MTHSRVEKRSRERRGLQVLYEEWNHG